MPRPVCTILIALLASVQLHSQPLPSHFKRSAFLIAPGAAFGDGLIGFSNAAMLGLLAKPELNLHWATDGREAFSLDEWGVFAGVRHFGLAVQRQRPNGVGVTDFRLSIGQGTPALAFGLGYGWSAGAQDALGRKKLISVGAISRPSRFFSLGLIGNFALETPSREGVAELGFRPFGTEAFTAFADAALQNGQTLKDAPWSVGVSARLMPGLNVVGRYFESGEATLGLRLNLGKNGAGGFAQIDKDGDYSRTNFHARLGGEKPSFVNARFGRQQRYLPLVLRGRIDYLKYRYLDAGASRFIDVLKNLEAATKDVRVSVVALNLSGMSVRPEHAWEIREQLKNTRAAGKKVIIFLETAGMTGYHLASVADHIVLDPQGSIQIPGYALGRTYFRGTLEKLGVGFDDWRFYKYKSLNESFVQDSMSVADREQNQEFVDDWYDLTRAEVSQARDFSPTHFDSLVDEQTYFLADDAVKAGLVDTLARWSAREQIIQALAGAPKRAIAPHQLLSNALTPQSWGTQPKIAVVYALGVCAMDSGIRARWLEQVLLALAKSSSIKAIVLRVDSPGGDGMASDVVAEALKKCAESKPVIISQGQVAASGGYWLSMYGDEILAGPNTVTGSIGVIWGWIFDKGLAAKLGMTSDVVKRGKHADLGRGVSLPFTPFQIPARNLTEEERRTAERIIRSYYDEFVKKVAAGRGLQESRVREIAEGRIYSGQAGKDVGLVDRIGGMFSAIAIAKSKAGLTPQDDIKIIEVPSTKGLFNLRQYVAPFGVEAASDPAMEFLKLVSEHRGSPLHLLLPGSYPDYETE